MLSHTYRRSIVHRAVRDYGHRSTAAVVVALLLVAGLAASPAHGAAQATAGTAPQLPALETTEPGHVVAVGQRSIDLAGTWDFITDPDGDGAARGLADPSAPTEQWDALPVPGNWDLYDRYANYQGVAWYRRDFAAPTVAEGERVRLRFDSVNWAATVYVNGVEVLDREGGFVPFDVDVTDNLHEGSNTVAVRVDNSFDIGATWSWGGISRGAELTIDPAVRIERQEAVVRPDLETGEAVVDTTVMVSNSSDEDREVSVGAAVTDLAGTPLDGAAASTSTVVVPARDDVEVPLSVEVDPGAYELWHTDRPNLYRATAWLDDADYVFSDRIGFRTVEVGSDGLRLNGERVRMHGFNRVPGDRVVGALEPEHVVRADLERVKAAGGNIMRLHHISPNADVLDVMDENGMLVVGEAPVWGAEADLDPARWRPVMTEIIHDGFNHPSVFAWAVGNEIASNTARGQTFTKEMIEHTRDLDPDRYHTLVSNRAPGASSPTAEASQYADFVSLNSYGSFRQRAERVRQLWPDKAVLQTEFNSDGFTFSPAREVLDYTSSDDKIIPDSYDDLPYVIGASRWTLDDYRSRFRGTSVNQVRGWGIQTLWGQPKRAYEQLQTANSPVAALSVDGLDGDDGRLSMLRLQPRDAVESSLPAWRLEGYRLVWEAVAADGTVTGRTFDLPDIEPGDDVITRSFAWSGEAVQERVSLMDPQGNEVHRDRLALAAPAATEPTSLNAGEDAVRIGFDRVAGAESYVAEVRDPDADVDDQVVSRGEAFLDDNIVVTNLPSTGRLQVRLVTRNDAGSTPGLWQDLARGEGHISPNLVAVVTTTDGDVVLGWSGGSADQAYDIRVNDVESSEVLQEYRTDLRGSSRVEDLPVGRAVEVRLRSVRVSGTGAWSEPHVVTTLPAGAASIRPKVLGVLSTSTGVAIRVEPVPRVTRYEVTVLPPRGGGGAVRTTVTAASDSLLVLDGLRNSSDYRFLIRAVTPEGTSAPARVSGTAGSAQTEAPPPAQVTGLALTGPSDDRSLEWDAVADADGYVVDRQGLCGQPQPVAFTAGTTYSLGTNTGTFQVRAVSGSAFSEPSAAVAVPALPGTTVIVDNDDDTDTRCDSTTPYAERGVFRTSPLPGYDGSSVREASFDDKTVTWTPDLPQDGLWQVEVWFPAADDTREVLPYDVTHAEGTTRVEIAGTEGGDWADLGLHAFDAGTAGSVALQSLTSTGFIRADAVRFTLVDPVVSDEVVALDAPSGLAVGGEGASAVLTWEAVEGARSYEVQAGDVCGDFTRAALVSGTEFAVGERSPKGGPHRVVARAGESTSEPSEPLDVPQASGQVVVDDEDTGDRCDGTVPYEESGTWLASALAGHDGSGTRYSNTAGSRATWTPELPAAGNWLVEVWFPAAGNNRATFPYQVSTPAGTERVELSGTEGGRWVPLGNFEMEAGTTTTVTLLSELEAGQFVRADAVRLTPADRETG